MEGWEIGQVSKLHTMPSTLHHAFNNAYIYIEMCLCVDTHTSTHTHTHKYTHTHTSFCSESMLSSRYTTVGGLKQQQQQQVVVVEVVVVVVVVFVVSRTDHSSNRVHTNSHKT